MKTVLVYGDSLSWGIVPGTRNRLPMAQRWPIVMEQALAPEVRVIEQCLNGRTTVFDEHFRPWRNGAAHLDFVLHCHAPLDLVILALGVNDMQSVVDKSAWASAEGAGVLIDKVQGWRGEPAGPPPDVLLAPPPAVTAPAGAMAEKFRGAPEKSPEQARLFAAKAEEKGCAFFAMGSVVQPSPIDGVHLDREAHEALGRAMAPVVAEILERRTARAG